MGFNISFLDYEARFPDIIEIYNINFIFTMKLSLDLIFIKLEQIINIEHFFKYKLFIITIIH